MMKTFFITGISRGLGLELTRHFLEKGHRVVGLSRTKSEALGQLIDSYPETLVWHSFDLETLCQDEDALKQVVDLEKVSIDVFIDNAAILYKDLIHRIRGKELSRMFCINTVIPIILTRMIINNFLRFKKAGAIVHMSSICAHRAFNGLSMMGATKAAIEAFSRDTAFEYGRFGIRSNTVVAGLLEIGMKSTVNNRLTDDLKSMTAMRKLVDTQSIVSIIDYLVSDDSHCITGENIHINAGIV